MNENERTESIKQVQRALRTLSKNGDDIPEVKEDGIFGSETTEAVRAFQRNAGMNQTGVVDYRTWEKIMNETRASIDKITPPLPITPFISDILACIFVYSLIPNASITTSGLRTVAEA